MANKQHIFTGVVPPSAAPTEVGHHYIDTAAKIMYLSVGTSTSGDWQVVGSGGAATWGAITGTLSSQTDLQAALDAKQDTITGSNDRATYKDGSGVIKSLEEVQVGIVAGWEQLDITRNMNAIAGTFDIYRNNLNINALQNSPNETWNLFQNQVAVDAINSGFNMGTNGNGFRFHMNNIVHNGTSDFGSTEFIQNNFSFGNGTDPIDVKGFAYMMGFGQINANANLSGPAQGYGFQFSANSAATISPTTYIQGFYDAANVGCASPNYTSFNGSPTILSVANNNNYNGILISPNITSFTGNAGGRGLVVAGNWGTFGTLGVFAGVSVNPTATNANYANGIEVYMNNVSMYAGTFSSLIIQDLTLTFVAPGDNNNIQVTYVDDTTAGSETAALAGNLITVHMDAGASTALQIKAAIQANPTLNSNLTVTVSGVGSNTQNAQAATNFAGGNNPGTKRAAYFGGDVEISGNLTFGGALSIGKLNAFATQALVDTGGNPQSLHSLITQPTVAANATLTSADMLGVNTAALITIGNNATVGTSFIGMAALGLPAVLSMGTGSTLDKCYGALFALSLDAGATGGVVDEVGLCKSLAIPNGATTVNKLYGYLFDLPYGDPGTNTWGFYSRTTNHNYFGGDLLIGGTAGSDDTVTNSSVALEIKSTTKAFMNARMTTTERNALTAVNGMQIYNTTTDKLQVYAAGSWIDLH